VSGSEEAWGETTANPVHAGLIKALFRGSPGAIDGHRENHALLELCSNVQIRYALPSTLFWQRLFVIALPEPWLSVASGVIQDEDAAVSEPELDPSP